MSSGAVRRQTRSPWNIVADGALEVLLDVLEYAAAHLDHLPGGQVDYYEHQVLRGANILQYK